MLLPLDILSTRARLSCRSALCGRVRDRTHMPSSMIAMRERD
jgi:hypothetical protein